MLRFEMPDVLVKDEKGDGQDRPQKAGTGNKNDGLRFHVPILAEETVLIQGVGFLQSP